MASSERIFKLLDTPPSIVSPERPQAAEVREGRVEFRNVTFGYNPGETILHDVSFTVAPGEKVAIVGATGAGKSTIIGLLSRFYEVWAGQICVDGIDIRRFDLHGLRRSIGIVLQDVFLFSGTVSDNIRLSNIEHQSGRSATLRLKRCMRPVSSRGSKRDTTHRWESGGHLCRSVRSSCSHSRAPSPTIPRILILDEATSSIDTETEILIRDALEKLLAGRTSIIIAHRLSTVQNADRIVVLHHGRVREMGNHQELLKLKGIYWKLYQLQYKDQLAGPRA